ncbi:MAG: FAD-binding oxidoreductase [Proteobacteria bacterium]|nr:FAD-binding oxidoreductase [Pseudomonadota bacterium]
MESFREDTMMRGSPDGLLVARDEAEIADALAFCNAGGVPVTFCASQTSMTGASVATEGLLISTEKIEGVVDMGPRGGSPVAVVRTGTVTAELQAEVEKAGFFFPVAPTSRDDCRIGGNIATNATGEDSYKYGPVRGYVKRLEIILPDGSRRTMERKGGATVSMEQNRGGYTTGWSDPIDLIIGSEGTLAYVSDVELSLMPGPPPRFFSALVPLESNAMALDLVLALSSGEAGLAPRVLELIDTSALALMKTAQGFPDIPDSIGAFIYVKQEYKDEAERDRFLERWYEAMIPFSGQGLIDHLIVGLSREEQERIRLWRHRIPEAANEWGRGYWPDGGGKIGSDWWVPMPRLREMMAYFYEAAESTGLPYMGYAHIGAGHPHTNFLARDPREKETAHMALIACCRKAVELGGGVAGEHGLGKLHTDLLPIQHDAATIEMMKAWKREYDPNWILGRGTIFS